MSDNPFDTDEQIQDVINRILHPTNDDQVSSALEEAEQLPEDARVYIADKIESLVGEAFDASANTASERRMMLEFIRDMRKAIAVVSEMRAEAGGSDPSEALEHLEGWSEIRTAALMSQSVALILSAKGESAPQWAKVYAARAGELTDAEYALPENHVRVLIDVLVQVHDLKPAAPKTNPFRKNMPGM